jgi:hypothetical protein
MRDLADEPSLLGGGKEMAAKPAVAFCAWGYLTTDGGFGLTS